MAHLTVPETIKIGDLSTYLSGNYIDQGQVYGDRLSEDMNRTIAMVTDALRWQWEAFPDVAEIRAVGAVTIDSIGDAGDNIAVFVNDPQFGQISLGNYTQSPSVTMPSEIALGLYTSMLLNPYGYAITYSGGTTIIITGREGSGAEINNSNNLYVVVTPTPTEFISTETSIQIASQNNYNLTTENY